MKDFVDAVREMREKQNAYAKAWATLKKEMILELFCEVMEAEAKVERMLDDFFNEKTHS